MENTIYIGLSRLNALQENMSLIANNIANLNTPGYKAGKMVFAEYLEKPEGMKEPISMVLDYGNFRVTADGPVKGTGNPLDVALEGPGYLGVRGEDGKTYYTRAGNFTLDSEGNLVTQQGYAVLDTGGAPIVLPPGTSDIVIDRSGQIATGEGVVGGLMVHEFDNLQRLKPRGNSLYQADRPGVQSEATKVIQGALEGSNAQGVVEMTDMIDVSRTYQSVSRMMQSEHDRLRSVIRTLTQQA